MYGAAMNQELLKCTTFAEMLDVIKKYMDVENAKPGQISKQTVISYLPQLFALVGAKPRK